MTSIRPRATGHPGYSETHPRIEQTAPLARRLVGTACAAWGLADEVTEAAALVMSELVSNAIRHASGTSVRVVVDRPSDERLYLAVVDHSPDRLPVPRATDAEESSGRGLLLVQALSDRWGHDRLGPASRPWGKRCWAELTVKKANPVILDGSGKALRDATQPPHRHTASDNVTRFGSGSGPQHHRLPADSTGDSTPGRTTPTESLRRNQ